MSAAHITNCHLGDNWKDCPACVEIEAERLGVRVNPKYFEAPKTDHLAHSLVVETVFYNRSAVARMMGVDKSEIPEGPITRIVAP